MMIDPMQALHTTSSVLVPTPKPTQSVSPVPTVIPNPPIYEELTKNGPGMKMLWVVFAIMLLSTLAFTGMAWRVPVQKRLFHVLTSFITLFATLSYFAMATGAGNSFAHIVVEETKQHLHTHIFRQVFYARYIDWALTTPLLLLDLTFLAGMNGADIIVVVVSDLVMVLTGLFAALNAHNETFKWGMYIFGCLAYLTIVWQLAVGGRRAALIQDSKTAKFFAAIGGFTLILWTLYPIVWALGDGSRILSVDTECLLYGVLDVLAKPIFGFWLLLTHAKSSAVSVEGFWSQGISRDGALRLDDDDGA